MSISSKKTSIDHNTFLKLAGTGKVLYYANYDGPSFSERPVSNTVPCAVVIEEIRPWIWALVPLKKDGTPSSRIIKEFSLKGLFYNMEDAVEYYEDRLAESERQWEVKFEQYEKQFYEMKRRVAELRMKARRV